MAAVAWTQVTYRLRNDDGNETAATWIAGEGTAGTINAGSNFRVRFLVDENNNNTWANKNFGVYYSYDGAAYAAVTTTTPIQYSLSDNFAQGADTTAQLTSAGTFVTDNNGMGESGVITNSGSKNYYFECEFCLKIDPVQVAHAKEIGLRVYNDTNPLSSYTKTATVTVKQVATGTLTKTLGNTTILSSGTLTSVTSYGTVTQTLGDATISASSTIANSVYTGTLTQTLGTATLTSSSQLVITGATTKTLDDVTTTTSCQTSRSATLESTLGDVTIAATSTIGNATATGDLTQTLADATIAANSTIANQVYNGALTQTLGNTTITSAAGLAIAGSTSATLDNVTITATAGPVVTGSTSATLDNTTITSSAALLVQGTLITTLADASINATSTFGSGAPITGTLTQTLENVTANTQSVTPINASLEVALLGIILVATGSIVLEPGNRVVYSHANNSSYSMNSSSIRARINRNYKAKRP